MNEKFRAVAPPSARLRLGPDQSVDRVVPRRVRASGSHAMTSVTTTPPSLRHSATRSGPAGMPPSYLPIAEHGVIGDQRSVALVGTDGTIDWYCPDPLDAPSVFASILDRRRGGFYRIASAQPDATTRQLYFPDTNVLITRSLCSQGVGEIHDFMALDRPGQELIRRVVGIRGVSSFRLTLEPRFNYGRDRHRVNTTPNGAVFETADACLGFASPVPVQLAGGGVSVDFNVSAGESRTFVLRPGLDVEVLTEDEADQQLRFTIAAWRAWLAGSTYAGR